MGYDIYNMKNFPLSEKYFDAENLFDFEIADKGVDILKNSFDPNIIKRAVYQAIFASIKVQCKSMLDNNLRYDMIEHNPKLFYSRNNKREIPIGSLTIPMVVTTAKIFKVRDNVTLEELEKEKDIRNLLEEKQGILLPYANYLDRKEFQKELISTDPTISSKSIKISEIEDFCSPNCVYIVNYEHLEKVFSNCIAKIESLCENYAKVFQKELKSKS